MVIALKKPRKLEKSTIDVKWPIEGWTFSHVRNIEYAIDLLKKSSATVHNPVIGYYLVRGWGTRDMYHQIIPKEEAERLKKEAGDFRYETLESLLKEMSEIKKHKYRIEKGLIVGLNPSYSK